MINSLINNFFTTLQEELNETSVEFSTVATIPDNITTVVLTTGNAFEILYRQDSESAWQRAQEGTVTQVWPKDTKVLTPVTAGMLDKFIEEGTLPRNHASLDKDRYGVATKEFFGHIRLTDDLVSDDSTSGIALSPAAVHKAVTEMFSNKKEWKYLSSSTFVVPQTGYYEVTCVGGGGYGGNGGRSFLTATTSTTGGGGGAGGAGETVVETLQLDAETEHAITVGGIGGHSSFGNLVFARAGKRGQDGTDASLPPKTIVGTGGAAGESFGTVSTNGTKGTTLDVSNVSGEYCGGNGGAGGVSNYGFGYGTGGAGGKAACTCKGLESCNPRGDGTRFLNGAWYTFWNGEQGKPGTQGFVKVEFKHG